jgi:oxaloacetate decarboxylase gamma subunit
LRNDALIEQGLDLMLFGMGTVFVFLTLLVVATLLMSVLIRKWMPEQEAPLADKERPAEEGIDPRIVRVIEAALAKHRQRRGR